VRYFASPYRKEWSANRINIHPEAPSFENTPNGKLFAVGRKAFDGK